MLHNFLDAKMELFKSPRLAKIKNWSEKFYTKYLIPVGVGLPIVLWILSSFFMSSLFNSVGNFFASGMVILASVLAECGLLSILEKYVKNEINVLEKERYARLFNESPNEQVCLENLFIIKKLLELEGKDYLTLKQIKSYQEVLQNTIVDENEHHAIYKMIFLSTNKEFVSLIDDIGEKNQEELKYLLKTKLAKKINEQIQLEQQKAQILDVELIVSDYEEPDLFQKPKHHSVNTSL